LTSKGKFQPKASSPCLAYGYYSDGVAIFWRNEVFSDDTNSPLPHPLTPPAYPTTFVSTILTHRLTNQPIFFLATHLKAKSSMECEEIRASQVRYLLAHMDQILTEKQLERCILLGDFNADPYPVPQKKTKGESQEGEEKMVNIPPLAVQSVRDWHDSFLESVYPLPQDGQSSLSLSSSSTEESSPPLLPMTYTTCKYRQGKESKHVIDYIFYSHRSLLVTSRLGTLDPQEIEQEGKPLALPNLKYPSDHISLVADMEIL
jgi:endonuclease/exonuclease/phosphatase family metal-dependent hydrolase